MPACILFVARLTLTSSFCLTLSHSKLNSIQCNSLAALCVKIKLYNDSVCIIIIIFLFVCLWCVSFQVLHYVERVEN